LVAVVSSVCLLSAAPSIAADKGGADPQKEELIGIMKGVNFVPQLGKDEPFCKSFYEDFKKQTNIEHIRPILKADKYDDPALQPYQEKCPALKMHKTMAFTQKDLEISGEATDEEDAESRAVSIMYGERNFQLFSVDIDDNQKNGKEYVFYYEGAFDQKSVIYGLMTPTHYPSDRVYRIVDFGRCKADAVIYFNQDASDKLTRNGIIHYKGKNGIYVLEARGIDQPSYTSLILYMYSERWKRIAGRCIYDTDPFKLNGRTP
jgi:hypothetical protein